MPTWFCFRSQRTSSMDKEQPEESIAPQAQSPHEGEMPAEVKIFGYLDKRGRRLPTWKRYWFVLDGPVLLRFQSEEDYKNLSPCQSILNMGRVVTLRPAGSRSAPQIVLVTEANVIYLRTKEQSEQQRWQAALHASIVKYSSARQPEPSNSARRYEDACVPTPPEPEPMSTVERVRRMGQQALLPTDQVVNASKSLRKVAPQPVAQVVVDDSVGEIKAKLPTNSAVHRMLERRQEDNRLEQERKGQVEKVEILVTEEAAGEMVAEADGAKGDKMEQTEEGEVKSKVEETKEEEEEVEGTALLKVENEETEMKVHYSQVNKNRKSAVVTVTDENQPVDKPKDSEADIETTDDSKKKANDPPKPTPQAESLDEGYDQIKQTYRLEDGYEAIKVGEEDSEEDIYAMPTAEEDIKETDDDEPLVPPRPQQETFHASPVMVLEADSPEPDYEETETLFSVKWSEPEPPPRPVEKSVERTFSADELDVLLIKGSKEDVLNRKSLDKMPSTPQVVRATPCVAGVESREERAERAAHEWTLDLPDVVPPKDLSEESEEVSDMSLEEAMQVIRRASRRIPKVSQISEELHEAVVARVHSGEGLQSLDSTTQAKRLSFAQADLELTLEETVDTLKTPFVSATFG